nr:MAG TPA: hypothetical protein [Caudoviricetes sp.]
MVIFLLKINNNLLYIIICTKLYRKWSAGLEIKNLPAKKIN